MNSHVEVYLALILFLPWFAILGYLYWRFPRLPRPRARRFFDAAALLLAAIAAGIGMQWSYFHADAGYGAMWKQVLATSVAYGLFLAVMTLAVLLRHLLLTNKKGDGARY